MDGREDSKRIRSSEKYHVYVCLCLVLVQRLPQGTRGQPASGGGVRRAMEIARFLRDVPLLLRHDRPVASDRREDVFDQRRRAQHDLAVPGRRHLWTCLPSSKKRAPWS